MDFAHVDGTFARRSSWIIASYSLSCSWLSGLAGCAGDELLLSAEMSADFDAEIRNAFDQFVAAGEMQPTLLHQEIIVAGAAFVRPQCALATLGST